MLTPPIPIPTHDPSVAVVLMINYERSRRGQGPLTIESRLNLAATKHCFDMAEHHKMSHTGTDRSSPDVRITREGYRFSWEGEIIAAGYPGYLTVVSGWMSSLGHRAIILGPHYTQIGSAVVRSDTGYPYWCCDFGDPA